MISFWIFLILYIAFLVFGAVEIFERVKNADPIKAYVMFFVSCNVPFIYSLLSVLVKHNLKVYFWYMRIINRIKNPTVKWSLSVRFEGDFNEECMQKVKEDIVNGKLLSAGTKIKHSTKQSLSLVVKDSLAIEMEYENKDSFKREKDMIELSFPFFEVSCNYSRHKLDKEIVPILETLKDHFLPSNSSYVLNVNFLGKNPFYTVFIDHLRLDQIDDFNVTLNIGEYSCNSKDLVSIRKDEISITTRALSALKELAKDFIFLSPNTNKMIQLKG